MIKTPFILCILDGWGEAPASEDNAITQAQTPHWDWLKSTYPLTFLEASGTHVGLPKNQMGNSEVGHMAMGSGRLLFQDLPRIDQALQNGDLSKNPALEKFIEAFQNPSLLVSEKERKSKKTPVKKRACHLMGLLSPGGVHSHMDHMIALAKILDEREIPVIVHGFLDGRDTPPQSAHAYVEDFLEKTSSLKFLSMGTLGGRYYGMDRDQRWDRIENAYKAMVNGQGATSPSALESIETSYGKGITDEFMEPTVIGQYQGIQTGDGLLVANFRADRVRQLLTALVDPDFEQFPTRPLQLASQVGMVSYSAHLASLVPALFPQQDLRKSLGEVLSNHGLTQLRLAETEKYAHVTFFFNGGREDPFPGEDRLLIPSSKVATYDLKPEMSAEELTDHLVTKIHKGLYDFIVVNYANADMVGHTGNLSASLKAVETVDTCLGRLTKAVEEMKGVLMITADHGNVEKLLDEQTQTPHTAHTCNLVPFLITCKNLTFQKLHAGKLSDIAPSILHLMGFEKPSEMSGKSFIEIDECA